VFTVGRDGNVSVFWVSSTLWCDSPSGRCDRPAKLPGALPPGAHVAVAQQGADVFDVFGVGADGTLNIWWIATGQTWSSRPAEQQRPLSHAGFVDPGGAVVTGTQQAGRQVDAIVIAKDGALHVASVVDYGAWVWADR